ncbi:MAG: serine hydrolase [Deltaproteobacteria bacterium]|nr:serine hydrolase [Deltaproteobacteria bacterium]
MQRRSRRFILVAILICVAAIPQLSHGFNEKENIDPLAHPLIRDQIVVGLAIGIVKNGKSRIIAYGETIRGSGITPDGDTLYEIGSVSKVFTGILLADMLQKGAVHIDDPLQKFLPSSINAPVCEDKPITLEHMVTHTSGLPRMPDNFKPANPLNPYADYTVEQMFAFLNEHKLKRPPGKYEYSNYAMGLLGYVLARRTGTPYEQLVVDTICKPLGMNDTRITLNQEQLKRLSPPYDMALKPSLNWDIPALAGAGAIRSSVNDMIKFIKANLKKDQQPLTQALRLSHVKRHTMDDGLSMGLGWHLARDGKTLWHNGGTGGYHAWLAVSPEHGVGVVVLANTANMGITQFGEQVTRIALGQTVKQPKPRKIIQVGPALLKSYAGFYAITPEFGLNITVENGGLMVQATGQDKFPVFPESMVKFFYKVVDAQITFVPNGGTLVNKLILHQNGRDLEAFRKN